MRAVAEVIDVGVTGNEPPIAPGTPVEFADLRCGVSAPEQRQRQDGGSRVVGGKLWWTCSGVRPVKAAAAA